MTARSLFVAVPVVVLAGTGLAWLTSAVAIDRDAASPAVELAQATPPAVPPAAGGPDQARQRPPFSPRAMCIEHVARAVGRRAALKVRLELKPEQLPKWQMYENAADEVTAKDLARCATLPTEMKDRPNFTERLNRREEMARSRLASLEAVKPSLMALYDSLTPEQKVVFDRPAFPGRRWPGRGFGRD
jgi:hypothetical protein